MVTLRVSEMTAAVQLIQALGGGWDPRSFLSQRRYRLNLHDE